MAIQVARGPATHAARWEFHGYDWDTGCRFILKCANCRKVFAELGWDWMPSDGGPTLGVVQRELWGAWPTEASGLCEGGA